MVAARAASARRAWPRRALELGSTRRPSARSLPLSPRSGTLSPSPTAARSWIAPNSTVRPPPNHRPGHRSILTRMSRPVPHRPHPTLAGAELAYVCSAYLPLEALARREQVQLDRLAAWIETGRLPRPAYLLPDGTAMFPPDLLDLLRAAGDIDALPDHFARRTELAARMLGIAPDTREADWEDYLSGEYGVCLRQVTPDTLVLKEMLVEHLDRALAAPRPDDLRWRHALAFEIDGLDALVRPFARVDRVRFGRPTSRERLIEAPRRRWPWLRKRRGRDAAEDSTPAEAR